MKPSEKFEAVKKLLASPGWEVIEEQLRKDREGHISAWVENRPVSQQEADFRRGAVWAIDRLLSLPKYLLPYLENEFLASEYVESMTGDPNPKPQDAGTKLVPRRATRRKSPATAG